MTICTITREQWGARYPDGFQDAPVPYEGIYLHHSVTLAPDLLQPFDDDDQAVRTLEQIGQDRFGGGISYTWAVTPVGRLYQGHSVGRRGAHTRGCNDSHRAVVLVGNYEVATPTEYQLNTVAALVAEEHKAGRSRLAALAGGHRDAPNASTACPGVNAYGCIREINGRVTRLLDSGDTPTVPTVPSGQIDVSGWPVLRYKQSGTAVRRYQEFMVRVFGSYNRYSPTGYFGDLTLAGTQEFQRRVGLVADGIVGAKTNAALAGFGYRP